MRIGLHIRAVWVGWVCFLTLSASALEVLDNSSITSVTASTIRSGSYKGNLQ